ncbi:branched-chain amino acid ABC transporter permease [Nocardioides sp. GY 10113]|uniref:AzlC family ABC transporter permease n=1 Tax=Nocardioides sp. GY 10113 TaxID=2569761 RepID=UPI0010A894AC|nr:AzlC family ABC transporter permease [Nocardioides sp. GY 10113]TIC88715.1 branched-chain amino acid ABC transporter permease [Nocardioides sp. GY 10113]
MSARGQRRGVVRDSVGVAVATGLYGASFGAVAVGSGLTVAQTCALSLLMFTGASQFALVGVVGAGGAPLAGTAAALLLGARNTLYGLRLAPLLGWRGWRRAAAAQVLIDESTAMAVNRPDRELARVGFLTTGVGILVLWNAFTLLGALAGEAIGDPRNFGLDAAVGAAFLALLWPRLREPGHARIALLAATLAALAVPFTPAGLPVLLAGGVAILVGALLAGRAHTPPPEVAP